jgi:hypothetical protein
MTAAGHQPDSDENQLPRFVCDIVDRATGKATAIEVPADRARRPLGAMLDDLLHESPETLVGQHRLPARQADTYFRIQDLVYPVTNDGRLGPAPYRGLMWRRRPDGFALDPGRPAPFERLRRRDGPDLLVLPLEIDRTDVGYDRNWRGFHARRFERFRPAVMRLLEEAMPGGIALDGPDAGRRLIERVAHRIWQAPFENYSRFVNPECPVQAPTPPIRLKTGDETVENILAGRGGVCTEKVLALKLITDAAGIASRPIFAGPFTRAPLPAAKLRQMLDELATYDFTLARRYMRYWDHVALEYRLSDGTRLLVDPSNGNIPFLCEDARPYLAAGTRKRTVPVRMLAVEEPVGYHDTPISLGLDFLFAWETWIADVDLMQVFDNQLGLLVERDFFVTVAMWGSRTKRDVALASWQNYAAGHGLGPRSARPESVMDFAERHPARYAAIQAALPGLEQRYREHILTRHGIDKPFRADLIVLDRRPLLAQEQGRASASPALP